jgi:uncharacterized protein YabN with tetrapyrrole methylase and pyrophosphatase domain
MNKESLVFVGTGIKSVGQLTMEAIAWMKIADKLLYLVNDPVSEEIIKDFNPKGAESLFRFYGEGKQRIETYNEMVDHILSFVRSGLRTCVAFYGHPGVFVYPSHEAIRIARSEGYIVKMLPGISAEDCLFADLGIDPSKCGCQSYEATDFLIRSRKFDPSSSLILWQIGVLGNWTFSKNGYDLKAIPLLLECLYKYYQPSHEVYLYEAAIYPGFEPIIKIIPLNKLGDMDIHTSTTLYIPPGRSRRTDKKMVSRLLSTVPGGSKY